jgi:2-polyprenyl-3-methyl-5-hydroxy-6-metoxy-1,4-benzoquinol methylase
LQDVPTHLKEVLAKGRRARLIEEDIYSVLPGELRHHYDRRSTVYDLVVGTHLYNSLMWGSSPRAYAAFAREAVASCAAGKILDAGCGSMLFTAPAYMQSKRPIVAFDQSLAMLRLARQRWIELAGSLPENILLLQADLSDLPFRAAAFHTVLFMNVLHHLEAARTLLPRLKELLVPDGGLYLTSLVSNHRLVGDFYLKTLFATGEFTRPRSELELKEILKHALGETLSYRTSGNMAFASVTVKETGKLKLEL